MKTATINENFKNIQCVNENVLDHEFLHDGIGNCVICGEEKPNMLIHENTLYIAINL
jgi:hypothetical protein